MYKIYLEDLRTPNVAENSIYWDGNDLHILLKDNKELILSNCYVSNISYRGLESETNENICIVGNTKRWGNTNETI